MSCAPDPRGSTFPVVVSQVGHDHGASDGVYVSDALPSAAQSLSTSPTSSAEHSAPAVTVQDHIASQSRPQKSGIMAHHDPNVMQWTTTNMFPFQSNGQSTIGYSTGPFAVHSSPYCRHPRSNSPYSDCHDMVFSSQYANHDFPRWYDGSAPLGLRSHNLNSPESYPPTAYQIVPQKYSGATSLSETWDNASMMSISDDYDARYDTRGWSDVHGGFLSPYSDMTRASTPHADTSSQGHCYNDNEDAPIDKEEPYAQLIYKALRQAPGHTMVLRDIYEWFKKNTDKASKSETKGWQNSIRHNLSMNGAFEKVDQPGEDSRKGYLWRLTAEALHEGVKSTTRYRSKQPSKRGARSQYSLSSRSSTRLAKSRRSKRIPEQYTSEPRQQPPTSAHFDGTLPSTSAAYTYPASPYLELKSEPGETIKVEQHEDFGVPLDTSHQFENMFSNPLPFGGVQMTQNFSPLGTYHPLCQIPEESSDTDSPSPTGSEPLTPHSAGEMWYEDSKAEGEYVYEETLFPEHGG